MKTDTLLVVGLAGVAAVLVAKGMGLSLSSVTGTGAAKAPSFAQSIWNPFAPISGAPYDPANPGAYIPNSQLINGTIHDYYSGNQSSYYTPTISAITDSVLSGMYGTNSQQQSVIRNPNAWW